MSPTLDAIIAIAAILFWIVFPTAWANRIGHERGHRHAWVFGLLGGWVGVFVAWLVLHEKPAPEPVPYGSREELGWGIEESSGWGAYAGSSAGGWGASEPLPQPQSEAHRGRDPLARLFPGLPRNVRVVLDWILTIAGAVLIVLALKQWVVNPYRIPSSSMEPTLHCAKPAPGCESNMSDRVLADRVIYDFENPKRGQIVVFNTPSEAALKCGEGGTFVKRLIGLPGETIHENGQGFISIREPGAKTWARLKEPYISVRTRLADVAHFNKTWHVPKGDYFFMGDNRSQSCDSRDWGPVPRHDLIGQVFFVYWPPDRIGFK
ncbi:MAG TPA: signal peptidase I [Gaiellaceae bacterium]|nr:signal peptidase I [Gaiellaceae bacterium]